MTITERIILLLASHYGRPLDFVRAVLDRFESFDETIRFLEMVHGNRENEIDIMSDTYLL